MKGIFQKILYYLFMAYVYAVSLLPLKVHYFFSDILAFLLRKVFRYRHSVIMINLARSFPDLQYKELRNIAKEYYQHMSDVISESIWMYGHSSKDVIDIFKFANPEILNEAYGDGRTVILLLSHQGNWELTGGVNPTSEIGVTILNDKMVIAYKPLSSKVSDKVFKNIRTKHNAAIVIESSRVFRHLMQKRNDGGGAYCLVADQFPDTGDKFVVDFLNQPTAMIKGPEYMATKLGLPVVYWSIQKHKRGEYINTFHKVTDDASKEEPGYVTKEYARLLQESINENKSTWLWSHKRWKEI